ncbi:MAG: DeoR/GlpR transcriptional regulator [Clostridiales bacterium]|nr:DeoR/GlpR transcriptional regulator [Clostridiales bacterium]
MFKIERLRKIKEILADCKQIDVSTLSSLLEVTDATIRNDLEELEKEGFLTRFHGGATLNTAQEEENNTLTFTGAAPVYDKDKEEIGEIASRLIQEREWIFLGPGTTSYYIAKALLTRNNINVLTNNFWVAGVLSAVPNIQCLFLGGHLVTNGFYSYPDDISAELHNIYLDKCFFSVDGVDFDAGYTLSDLSVQELIRTITPKCKEIIFGIDCSKFGKRAFRKIGDLDFPDIIITNDTITAEYKNYYLEHQIGVYTSYNLENWKL